MSVGKSNFFMLIDFYHFQSYDSFLLFTISHAFFPPINLTLLPYRELSFAMSIITHHFIGLLL